ncbi:MAG: RluA family pseudouridine synthase [Bdellovibrionota bacterium]|nr:MAG: RluA family pseudouridine synthase [Pseudomonadota bacterium]
MARAEQNPTILTVSESDSGRLDQYLVRELPSYSRSSLQNWIKAGLILVNGSTAKTGYDLSPGDVIEISQAEVDVKDDLDQPSVPLDILYEDDAILIINKPAGLTIHPGAGTKGQPTVASAFKAYMGAKALPGDQDRPGIVHRLDKETTGVMVLAKTTDALRHLAAQFKDKSNFREYVTLLDGVLPSDEMMIESYLYRDPRHRLRFASMTPEEYQIEVLNGRDMQGYRYAKSFFNKRKVYGNRLTLATVRLSTGRTHQIRVHARTLKCAVVGDNLYAPTLRLPQGFAPDIRTILESADRQLLHARRLGIIHPVDGRRLAFEAPLPSTFRSVLELLEKYNIAAE